MRIALPVGPSVRCDTITPLFSLALRRRKGYLLSHPHPPDRQRFCPARTNRPVSSAPGASGGLGEGGELAPQRQMLERAALDRAQLLAAHAELALELRERQRLALLAVEAEAQLDDLALALGQLL